MRLLCIESLPLRSLTGCLTKTWVLLFSRYVEKISLVLERNLVILLRGFVMCTLQSSLFEVLSPFIQILHHTLTQMWTEQHKMLSSTWTSTDQLILDDKQRIIANSTISTFLHSQWSFLLLHALANQYYAEEQQISFIDALDVRTTQT